jgi:hypothetical protein
VPALALLFDRCGCFLYNLLTSSSACSAKSLYGVYHIQGPYRELDPPFVHPIFRIISNACWSSVGIDVSFVSLALFVLFCNFDGE